MSRVWAIWKCILSSVGTGLAPISANLRKEVRTNRGRKTVGVVPCADPGGWVNRVGARHDPYEGLFIGNNVVDSEVSLCVTKDVFQAK